ncbi:hypothetical protein ACVWZV_003403 [Bradyrhizobium sp. GM5.1]|jgi:hypothetical protein
MRMSAPRYWASADVPAISQSLIVGEEKTPSAIASKYGWAFDEYGGKGALQLRHVIVGNFLRSQTKVKLPDLLDQEFYDFIVVGWQ